MVLTHYPKKNGLVHYPTGKMEYEIHLRFHVYAEIFLLISHSQTFYLQSLNLSL